MLIQCDDTCANYGCKNQNAHGCAAHTEPAKPEPSTLLIYIEAVLFLAAIVMCYLCIVTWGAA